MSDPPRRGKLDRLRNQFKRLHFRFRRQSQAASATPTGDGLPSDSTAPVAPTANATSSQLTTTPVRDRLTSGNNAPVGPTANVASSQPATTPVGHGLASGSTAPVGPTANAASSQPAASARQISLDDVLETLEPQHQSILLEHRTDPADVGNVIQNVLDAAGEKKRLCDEKKWRLTIGNKTIILRDKADIVIDLISKFKDVGSIAVGADPVHAGLPWAGVCLLLQIFVAEKEQMDALMNGILVALSMQQTANLYLEIYNDQLAGPHAEELRKSLLRLYAAVLTFLAEALRLLSASGPTRFCHSLLSDDNLQKFPSRCRELLEDVGSALRLCDRQLDERTAELVNNTKNMVTDIVDQLEELRTEAIRTRTKITLAKLPVASGAQHDSYHPDLSSCLEGTRVDLLAEISQWVNDPTGECFFWLQGNAGEGKSTIAKTVAETLRDQDMLGASFFFKRGHADRGNARLFFSTIASQLVRNIDGLGSDIAGVLDSVTSTYDKSVQIQFEELMAVPLRKSGQPLRSTRGELVIVVDALDECRDSDIKQLVGLLAQAGAFGIRTFITSRPDEPVIPALTALKDAQYRTLIPKTHTKATIDHDISLFLKSQLDNLRSEKPTLAKDWPGPRRMEELARRSLPLFIFAATICRFLLTPGSTPEELLHTVFQEPSRLPLTMTYRPVLERWLAVRSKLQSREAAIAEFRNIVGTILLAAEPLPVALAVLMSGLGIDKLEARLALLRSVLQIGDLDGSGVHTIKSFHLSFQDFVIRSDDALDLKISEQRKHKAMTAACLSLSMQPGKLRKDICAVDKPGTRRLDVETRVIDAHIEPDLAYACRYWLYHEVRSGELPGDNHQVYEFLTRCFLYWFEAMAWLGKADEVLRTLRDFKFSINVRRKSMQDALNTDESHVTRLTELFELVVDAHHFVRNNHYIADQAPLQLYASALLFAPEHSQIRSLFETCIPRWFEVPPKGAQSWDDDTLVLEGHTAAVTAVSFSPGEQYIATCSDDGILHIWEMATGICIAKTPEQGCGRPVALSFSDDGERLAVAYVDESCDAGKFAISVVIYDAKTSTVIKIFDRIRAGLLCVGGLRLEFTPASKDELLVATACNDVLELWRMQISPYKFERKSCLRTTQGWFDFAISASASLISGFTSDNTSITTWELESGAHVSTHSVGRSKGRSNKKIVGFFGKDLVYSTKDLESDGLSSLQKLNIYTGQIEHFIHFDELRTPRAISLAAFKVAFIERPHKRVVYIRDPPQCLMSANESLDQQPAVLDLVVSQDGKMLLFTYQKHFELRDLTGDVVFRSSKLDFVRFLPIMFYETFMSDDGSVIAIQLLSGTRVWFVKSGREILLPNTNAWACVPAISGDDSLMVFCFKSVSLHSSILSTHIGQIIVLNLKCNQETVVFDKTYDSGSMCPAYWTFFSEDNKTLLTEKWDLDLTTGDWKSHDFRYLGDLGERLSRIELSHDGDWILFDRENILWIPGSHGLLYRVNRREANVGRNTVAYVCPNGKYVTMKFAGQFDPSIH